MAVRKRWQLKYCIAVCKKESYKYTLPFLHIAGLSTDGHLAVAAESLSAPSSDRQSVCCQGSSLTSFRTCYTFTSTSGKIIVWINACAVYIPYTLLPTWLCYRLLPALHLLFPTVRQPASVWTRYCNMCSLLNIDVASFGTVCHSSDIFKCQGRLDWLSILWVWAPSNCDGCELSYWHLTADVYKRKQKYYISKYLDVEIETMFLFC